jgi:hypothetical protein
MNQTHEVLSATMQGSGEGRVTSLYLLNEASRFVGDYVWFNY